jgi:hypothetical protein
MEQGSMYDQSHCCVLARFDSRQTGEFKMLANLLNFRQRAIDAQGASYGLYSFWISDKFSLFIPIAVVAIIFIMPANSVV